jgi:hypothetical protein
MKRAKKRKTLSLTRLKKRFSNNKIVVGAWRAMPSREGPMGRLKDIDVLFARQKYRRIFDLIKKDQKIKA